MGYALKLQSVDFAGVAVDRVTYVEPVPCTGITLNKNTLSFESVMETQTLIATVTPVDTTDYIAWESSDENVATVQDGVVTIHGIGTAVITAQCGSQTASAAINQTTIKPQYSYKTVSGRTAGSNSVGDDHYILGTSPSSSQAVGGQPYSNADHLRVRGGSTHGIECIPVPYGATKVGVNVDDTAKPNYIEVVNTQSMVTVDNANYPEFLRSQAFPFANGTYAVSYGEAFAFRGQIANIEAVNYVYFE